MKKKTERDFFNALDVRRVKHGKTLKDERITLTENEKESY